MEKVQNLLFRSFVAASLLLPASQVSAFDLGAMLVHDDPTVTAETIAPEDPITNQAFASSAYPIQNSVQAKEHCERDGREIPHEVITTANGITWCVPTSSPQLRN